MEAGLNNFQFKERGSGLAVVTAFGLGTTFGLGFGLATLSGILHFPFLISCSFFNSVSLFVQNIDTREKSL